MQNFPNPKICNRSHQNWVILPKTELSEILTAPQPCIRQPRLLPTHRPFATVRRLSAAVRCLSAVDAVRSSLLSGRCLPAAVPCAVTGLRMQMSTGRRTPRQQMALVRSMWPAEGTLTM